MNPIVSLMSRSTDDYVPEETSLIKSADDSRTGLIVPELVFKYGSIKSHIRKSSKVAPWLIHSIYNRQKGYRDISDNPPDPGNICHEELIEEMEDLARSLGCLNIGYAKVPGNMIFRNKTILFDNAIVLSMEMDRNEMKHAPDIKAGKEVWRIYDRLGDASNKIARFLRERGFGAQAGAALGGDVNYPLLARKAGMGWIGTNGLLISPEAGGSQRLAAVFTSIGNLPFFEGENPYKWIEGFCSSCGRCIKKCPGKAIYPEKPAAENGGPKHIDHTKCAVPFSQTMGCSVCIAVCPFFTGNYDKIRKAFMKR
ncbi:4Fe-4S dicluster domain-containing protein [Spirochaeta isovalerica]|uniref:Ferredoxin n=1 Tax=Spirochaeta isovalerica TaxID=150 RepID=A0A841RFQ5_9SPIO|nr:4Fe-4S dicluster domain-containing protein [Spirochaeta isovalerica]MBB6481398.1 ferredoxin [Spirochaeta isovalerica]